MGSVISTLASKKANEWKLKVNHSNSTVSTVAGKQKVNGLTDYLDINIHGRSGDIPFYVLDNNNGYDMILGKNFFKKFDSGTQIVDGDYLLLFGEDKIVLNRKEDSSHEDIDIELINSQVLDDFEDFDQEWKFPNELEIKPKEKLTNNEQKTFDKIIVPIAKNLFAKALKDLGCYTDAVHEIELTDKKPIRAQLFRRSEFDRQRLKKETDELLDAGIIRPSKSDWNSTPFMVPKADGSSRMVINYIPLNKVTVRNLFPMNRIDDVIERVARFLWYTDLDLKQGFLQILLHVDSIKYTAFSTPDGHFEFVRLPFGLMNAPFAFQKYMQQVLGHLPFVSIYLDNFTIHSNTFDEHVKHVAEVLKELDKKGLKLNFNKSTFFSKEIKLLGHVISKNQIKMDPEKIKAI